MTEDPGRSAEPIERQIYLEHRKGLVTLFDKTLLLLSTGALGVSALFVDTTAAVPAINNPLATLGEQVAPALI